MKYDKAFIDKHVRILSTSKMVVIGPEKEAIVHPLPFFEGQDTRIAKHEGNKLVLNGRGYFYADQALGSMLQEAEKKK